MTCHGLSSSPLSVLFNFFFLLERKFFKEGAGRGGEESGKRANISVRVWEWRTRTAPYSLERLEAIFSSK